MIKIKCGGLDAVKKHCMDWVYGRCCGLASSRIRLNTKIPVQAGCEVRKHSKGMDEKRRRPIKHHFQAKDQLGNWNSVLLGPMRTSTEKILPVIPPQGVRVAERFTHQVAMKN